MSKKTKRTKVNESPGFTQYKVHWNGVNFKLHVDGVEFYGWRRITSSPQDGTFWAVDIFAQREGKHFAVKSVPYLEKDPMVSQKSLDADLCAIANEWWYKRCQGNHETLNDLLKRAGEPVLIFNNVVTLDHAINELRRFRHEALSSGHQRYMGITSDGPRDPRLTIRINLRKDAEAARKKPLRAPSPSTMIIDVPPGSSPGPALSSEDSQDVLSLLMQLERTTDKAQGRRLRASLRKLGYNGGAKAIRAQVDAQAKAKATAPEVEAPKATRSKRVPTQPRKGTKHAASAPKPRQRARKKRSK